MTSYTITYNDQTGGWWWNKNKDKNEEPRPHHTPHSIMERNEMFKQQHNRSASPTRAQSPTRSPSPPRTPSPRSPSPPRTSSPSSPGRVRGHIRTIREMSKKQLDYAAEKKRKALVNENLKHLEDLFSFNFTSPPGNVWKRDGNNLVYQKREISSNFGRRVSVTIDKNKIIDLIKNVHSFINMNGNKEEKEKAKAIIETFKVNYNKAIKTYLLHTAKSHDHSVDKYFKILVRLITYAAHYNGNLKSNIEILNKYANEADQKKAVSLLMRILVTDLPKEESNSILSKMGLIGVI